MTEVTNSARYGDILVVDDATANLQFLANLLTEQGYAVFPASDGELALEFARATPPGLILLDIRMPGMDGFEICRRLKADERTRDIPVIFISILEDERDKAKGFRAGAVDYITKPFQPEEVLARIAIQLRLKELTENLEQKVAERTCELRRLNRELRAISDCNLALMKAEDEQTLLYDVCRIICDEAGYRMAWVGYPEHDESKTLRMAAWGGLDDGYLSNANITWGDTERGRGPGGTAIRTGKTALTQDFATDPLAAPWRESALQRGYRSCICLPLKNNEAEVFGALGIYSTEPNAFTPDEIRLLEELAGGLAYGVQALRNRIERKRAEERLRESETKYFRLVEAASEGIWMLGENLATTYVNKQMAGMLGYSCEEMIGRPVTDFMYDEDVPDHRQRMETRTRGVAEHYERRYRHKNGQAVWTLASAVPIMDADNIFRGAFAMYADITEGKLSEAELRRIKGELEQRVKERTAELEEKNKELARLNKLFVGRELRMVELKERIRELEKMRDEAGSGP